MVVPVPRVALGHRLLTHRKSIGIFGELNFMASNRMVGVLWKAQRPRLGMNKFRLHLLINALGGLGATTVFGRISVQIFQLYFCYL